MSPVAVVQQPDGAADDRHKVEDFVQDPLQDPVEGDAAVEGVAGLDQQLEQLFLAVVFRTQLFHFGADRSLELVGDFVAFQELEQGHVTILLSAGKWCKSIWRGTRAIAYL
jgi:hypothetical protein